MARRTRSRMVGLVVIAGGVVLLRQFRPRSDRASNPPVIANDTWPPVPLNPSRTPLRGGGSRPERQDVEL